MNPDWLAGADGHTRSRQLVEHELGGGASVPRRFWSRTVLRGFAFRRGKAAFRSYAIDNLPEYPLGPARLHPVRAQVGRRLGRQFLMVARKAAV